MHLKLFAILPIISSFAGLVQAGVLGDLTLLQGREPQTSCQPAGRSCAGLTCCAGLFCASDVCLIIYDLPRCKTDIFIYSSVQAVLHLDELAEMVQLHAVLDSFAQGLVEAYVKFHLSNTFDDM